MPLQAEHGRASPLQLHQPIANIIVDDEILYMVNLISMLYALDQWKIVSSPLKKFEVQNPLRTNDVEMIAQLSMQESVCSQGEVKQPRDSNASTAFILR
jgi:hypothetical protein